MKLIEIIILLLVIVIVVINSTDSAQTIDDMKQKPELFLIGAMKCGTTTLFDLLTQHPQICNDAHKEKHYYDKAEEYQKGYKFYMSMFEGCDPNLFYLDATPRYVNIDEVPSRLLETYGKSLLATKKFILILREPISRHYSEYQMRVRVCKYAFKDADEEKRIDRNCDRITANWEEWSVKGHWAAREKELIFYTFAEWLESEDGSHEISRGHYIQHVTAWLQYVDRSQLFIINFSSLLSSTPDTMTRLSKFIGLKTDWGDKAILPVPAYASRKPETYIDCKSYDYLDNYYKKINQNIISFINDDVNKNEYEPYFSPFIYKRDCVDV